jgi:hypothetical protein
VPRPRDRPRQLRQLLRRERAQWAARAQQLQQASVRCAEAREAGGDRRELARPAAREKLLGDVAELQQERGEVCALRGRQ